MWCRMGYERFFEKGKVFRILSGVKFFLIFLFINFVKIKGRVRGWY